MVKDLGSYCFVSDLPDKVQASWRAEKVSCVDGAEEHLRRY